MHFFAVLWCIIQSGVLDVSFRTTRFPSTRVRIPAALGGDNQEHQFTIDFATDMPYMAQTFFRNHAKLRYNRVFLIPPGAISLRSADGTPLKILGYIRFALTLGNKPLPMDAILIDDSIMQAFGAKLDWAAERL